MSTAKHTAEPWAVEPRKGQDGTWITGRDGHRFLAVDQWRTNPADCARIVACVNACAGLEAPTDLADILREAARLLENHCSCGDCPSCDHVAKISALGVQL